LVVLSDAQLRVGSRRFGSCDFTHSVTWLSVITGNLGFFDCTSFCCWLVDVQFLSFTAKPLAGKSWVTLNNATDYPVNRRLTLVH